MKYIVKKGDTLSDIAKDHYGHDDRFTKDWRDIWESNKGKIDNPNLIYPGQELDLPDNVFDLSDWIKGLFK